MDLSEYLENQQISQAAFGARLKVTQSAVSQWLLGRIPAERVAQIVSATDGRVSAHELRPDLYPAGFQFPQVVA